MSDGRKFQLNIKFGGGYEAPLLNVEGDTQQEFQQNVAFVVNNVEEIVKAATVFQASYNVFKPQDNPPPQQSSWSNSGSQQSQQPAASSTPGGPAPTCRHGEMKYVPGGVSKRTQKPYDAFWSCTGPRNEQCDTVKA